MSRENKTKSRKKNDDVDSYRHETDTRKNAVPVGLASYDTTKPKPKKYDCDPHLDPQLVWSGKKEHTSFEVPTVSLHIHERIAPEAGLLTDSIIAIETEGHIPINNNEDVQPKRMSGRRPAVSYN